MDDNSDSSLSEQCFNEIQQNSGDETDTSTESTDLHVVFNGRTDNNVTIDDVVGGIHALQVSGIFDRRYEVRAIIKPAHTIRARARARARARHLRLARIEICAPEAVIARQELLANLASRHRQALQQRQDWLNSFSSDPGTSQSYVPPPDEVEDQSWSGFMKPGQSQDADVSDEDSDDEPRLSIVIPEDVPMPDSPEAEDAADEEEPELVAAPAPRAASPPPPHAVPVLAPREEPIVECMHRNLPPQAPRYQRPRSTVIRYTGKHNN